jgi:hypothetical protein
MQHTRPDLDLFLIPLPIAPLNATKNKINLAAEKVTKNYYTGATG